MKFSKSLSKRGLALFLALMMCISLLPTTVLAAEIQEATHVDHNKDGWTCEYVKTDELICGLEEHEHTAACSPEVVMEADTAAVTDGDMDLNQGDITDDVLVDSISDTTGEIQATVTDETQTMGLSDEEGLADSADANYICGKQEHVHTDECYAHEWRCIPPSENVTRFLRAVKLISDEVTLADEEAITNARNAYDVLTEDDKANVSVVEAYAVLTNAETVLETAKADAEKVNEETSEEVPAQNSTENSEIEIPENAVVLNPAELVGYNMGEGEIDLYTLFLYATQIGQELGVFSGDSYVTELTLAGAQSTETFAFEDYMLNDGDDAPDTPVKLTSSQVYYNQQPVTVYFSAEKTEEDTEHQAEGLAETEYTVMLELPTNGPSDLAELTAIINGKGCGVTPSIFGGYQAVVSLSSPPKSCQVRWKNSTITCELSDVGYNNMWRATVNEQQWDVVATHPQPVYVYMRIADGISNAGWTLNDKKFYTIGEITVDLPEVDSTKSDGLSAAERYTKYKDEINEALQGIMRFSGNANMSLDLSALDWTAAPQKDHAFGLLTSNGADDYDQSNNQVWHLNGLLTREAAEKKYRLTISYVDESGKPLHEAYIQEELSSGSTYEVKSPEISGYELVDSDQATVKGQIGNTDAVVTVTYRKVNDPTPEKPNQPTVTKGFGEDAVALAVGQTIPYVVTIGVTGTPEKPVTGIKITDAKFNTSATVNGQSVTWTSLGNDTYSCTLPEKITNTADITVAYSYTVIEADVTAGKIVNTATVSTLNDNEPSDPGSSTATVATYVVNYYEKGTTTSVEPSKTVTVKFTGTSYEVSEDAVSVDNYTVDGASTKTLTINGTSVLSR